VAYRTRISRQSPESAGDVSPFEHPAYMPYAYMPYEAFRADPFLILIAIAVVVAGLGLLFFRRRGVNVR
jgi:putative exporter of polyketide antibiotics